MSDITTNTLNCDNLNCNLINTKGIIPGRIIRIGSIQDELPQNINNEIHVYEEYCVNLFDCTTRDKLPYMIIFDTAKKTNHYNDYLQVYLPIPTLNLLGAKIIIQSYKAAGYDTIMFVGVGLNSSTWAKYGDGSNSTVTLNNFRGYYNGSTLTSPTYENYFNGTKYMIQSMDNNRRFRYGQTSIMSATSNLTDVLRSVMPYPPIIYNSSVNLTGATLSNTTSYPFKSFCTYMELICTTVYLNSGTKYCWKMINEEILVKKCSNMNYY